MKYILLAVFFISACGMSRYTVEKSPYGEPGEFTPQQAEDALTSLEMTIASSNYEVVESDIIRKYRGEGMRKTEYQVWVKVFPQAGMFKVYCTQRRLYTGKWVYTGGDFKREGSWYFKKCKDPWILNELDRGTDVLDYVLASQS